MGKYGTPATKTMENTRISSEGKRIIEGPLGRLSEFQFTSVTTLRTEGIFGVYNRDQVVPSAHEFKYLSSRSALECAAMKSAMRLEFKWKRETRYEHRDDCQMPKATVILCDQKHAPLLQWLDSVTNKMKAKELKGQKAKSQVCLLSNHPKPVRKVWWWLVIIE